MYVPWYLKALGAIATPITGIIIATWLQGQTDKQHLEPRGAARNWL